MKTKTALWFTAPFLGLFGAFGLFPLLFTLFISVFFWDPIEGTGEFFFRGTKFYGLVLSEPTFYLALGRTLLEGLPLLLLQHLVAIPLAFALHLTYRHALGALGVLLLLPMIASPVALVTVLTLLTELLSNPLGDVLRLVRLELPDATGDVFALLWRTLGINVLLYLMALSSLPRSLLEAAQLDGAGFWRQLRHIALPALRPMIFVAASISLVQNLGGNAWRADYSDFDNAKLPGYIFGTAFKYSNFSMSATQTWLFLLVLLGLVGVLYWLFGRNFSLPESNLDSSHAPVLPAPSSVAIKIAVVFFGFLTLLPLLYLFSSATQDSWGSGINLRIGDQLESNYQRLLADAPNFWRSLYNSVYIACLAALFAVFSSSLAGFALALLEFRYKHLIFFLVLCILVFPALSNAIPHLTQMRLLGWIDTPRALWLPAGYSALGVFLVRQYLLAAIPKSLVEAAQIDGAGAWQLYWRIALPNLTPVLVTVGILTLLSTWNLQDVAVLMLRSDVTRVFSQTMGTLAGSSSSGLLLASAIGALPLLLILLFGSGLLGRGFGLTQSKAPQDVLPPQPEVLSGADFLRAVACLAVVFSHYAQRLSPDGLPQWLSATKSFLMQGGYGVSAFFVLSGMLLSLPFWRKYLSLEPAPKFRVYLKRRFWRIAPGYYVALIAAFFFARTLETGDLMWWRLGSGLTFTSSFHYTTMFPTELNGPLWSIGFEFVAYLLLPLFMLGLFLLRRHFAPSLGFGLVYWFVVLALVVGAHFWILHNLVPDSDRRSWNYGLIGGAKFWMPNYNPIGWFSHYIIGVLCAALIVHRQRSGAGKHLVFDGLVLVAMLGSVVWIAFMTTQNEFAYSLGSQPYAFPLFPVLMAVLLFAGAFSKHIMRWLENPFIRTTARLSFGIYIWHYFIIEMMRLWHNEDFKYGGIGEIWYWVGLCVFALSAAYGFAAWSYKHIEAPFLRRLVR
jgi:ABC-type glycerol-3-phosphate transport system permease component/peptidoglycan/LPS O-acetylase OafA/YrhL